MTLSVYLTGTGRCASKIIASKGNKIYHEISFCTSRAQVARTCAARKESRKRRPLHVPERRGGGEDLCEVQEVIELWEVWEMEG